MPESRECCLVRVQGHFLSFMTAELRDRLTHEIIGAAIQVHSVLGPGILESAFEECLCFELSERRIPFGRQVALPIKYKGIQLEHGFRPDLNVDNRVIVELKCVEKLLPVHQSQILTYMKLSGMRIGLLININSPTLIAGVKRMVLDPSELSECSASTSGKLKATN